MSSKTPIPDAPARARALDPLGSFIVQAPAGSGKTGLITQRYLKLLSGVELPEEIVAITFTRKAAAEMRQRIVEALTDAGEDAQQDDDYAKQTKALARAALARDQQQGWHLLDNPNRLRLQTIDSLCARLARQMPILSRFGSLPAVAEDAAPLYLAAARNTLADLDSSAPWADEIAHLVRHLDNRLDRLQQLLATMLARRDQWLIHLASPQDPLLRRDHLESAMRNLTTDLLEQVAALIQPAVSIELCELAQFAARHLPAGSTSQIGCCEGLDQLPGSGPEDLEQWSGLAELLLTQGGSWRKSVNVRVGFPPASSGADAEEKSLFGMMKERMGALLDWLREEEALREALQLLRSLPPQTYSDEEWETLSALVSLLRVAAANLELIFTEQGQVDFPALVQAANRALGEADAPTDLALALDYRIRHLLVDEFQDTSRSQFELIGKLIAGWSPGDGHTLFLVGDPMQSIYRFREADVGLFITAMESGVNGLPLEFLRLSVNFRSQEGIIEWINEQLPGVLAPIDDIGAGAISFAPSAPHHPRLPGSAVSLFPLLGRDDVREAEEVVNLVRAARAEDPQGTIAILVRNRSHLAATIALLKRETIPFQAVEIELLAQRPVVQDLLSLTRAISHLGDRVAWLSLLRAPWCGLDLADLHALAGAHHARTIIDLLNDGERIAALSTGGQARIARILPQLNRAIAEQGRASLRSTIEGLWCALGGPACVAGKTDLADSEVYLQLLERIATTGALLSPAELATQVDHLFAQPDVHADGSLQLMTIHRAKGLEFDTVIVPGLGRRPRGDEERLMYWLDRGRHSGERDLLLAPINPSGEARNPIAAYLRELDRTRNRHEMSRLVYVAATRARARLHLLAHVNITAREEQVTLGNPAQESLLARLWPAVVAHFEAALEHYHPAQTSSAMQQRPYRRSRLPEDWALPLPTEPITLAQAVTPPSGATPVDFDWAGETARHIGTVAHRLLQQVARIGIDALDAAAVARLERMAPRMLEALGVSSRELESACADVNGALKAAAEQDRGRWILSNSHSQAESELALTGVRGGAIDHMVIDRTFVDGAGVRWVIDYKMGTHRGGGLDAFLDREQERYRAQLERYGSALRGNHEGPVRLGLYFPLANGWREWPLDPPPGG